MAILRFVFLALLFLVVVRLLRSLLAAGRAPAPRPRAAPPATGERLVDDPVCGLCIPESRALRDGDRCFCSEECRDRFRASA